MIEFNDLNTLLYDITSPLISIIDKDKSIELFNKYIIDKNYIHLEPLPTKIKNMFLSLIIQSYFNNTNSIPKLKTKLIYESKQKNTVRLYNNNSLNLIIKHTKNSLETEYETGLKINTLGLKTFYYTYGYLQNENLLVTEYIEGITLHEYLYYTENNSNGVCSDEHMQICTRTKHLIEIILIILLSLQIAYLKLGFIHNDLHTKNIILINYNKKPFELSYENKTYTFYPKYLPVIIDYGLSHSNKLDKENLTINLDGPNKDYDTKIGIYKDKRISGYDSYKLLLYILNVLLYNYKKTNKIKFKNSYNHLIKRLYNLTKLVSLNTTSIEDILIDTNNVDNLNTILKKFELSNKGYHALNIFNDNENKIKNLQPIDYFNNLKDILNVFIVKNRKNNKNNKDKLIFLEILKIEGIINYDKENIDEQMNEDDINIIIKLIDDYLDMNINDTKQLSYFYGVCLLYLYHLENNSDTSFNNFNIVILEKYMNKLLKLVDENKNKNNKFLISDKKYITNCIEYYDIFLDDTNSRIQIFIHPESSVISTSKDTCDMNVYEFINEMKNKYIDREYLMIDDNSIHTINMDELLKLKNINIIIYKNKINNNNFLNIINKNKIIKYKKSINENKILYDKYYKLSN